MKLNKHNTKSKLFVALFNIYSKFIQLLLLPILLFESRSYKFNKINERPIEYSFLLKHLCQIYPEHILDVGSGKSALPTLLANCGFKVTATDKKGIYWQSKYFNRHYHIIKDDVKNSKLTKKFDFINCISVLEHIPDYNKAVAGMFNLLKPNGYLLLSFPYNKDQYIPNVYELEGAGYGHNSYICQVFSQKEVNNWLHRNNGKIVEQKYYKIFNGDFWTFGNRIYPPYQVDKEYNPHLTCVLIQKVK